MPERFPPIVRVRTRAKGAGAGSARISVGDDASFVCLVRGMVAGSSVRTSRQVGTHIIDVCQPLFDQRATSMLDDLAELWWRSEHEGARVRPFASLPIGDRAELRARVKRLLAERTADTLGDQAVLEGETKRLLELPELALRRANSDLERRAERDRQGWSVAASAMCAIFAAGRASIAHIGDCRAVRMRRGIYDVLTHEHVLPEPGHDIVIRAVGHWGEGPERVELPVERGDLFLFMTRGLFHLVPEDVIKTELRTRGLEAASSLALQEQFHGTTQEIYAVAVEIL